MTGSPAVRHHFTNPDNAMFIFRKLHHAAEQGIIETLLVLRLTISMVVT